MRKFTRLDEPEILKNNWEKWGKEYQNQRIQKEKNAFKWHEDSYQQTLSLLLLQTDDHCSYCDSYHLKRSDFTIDHFKPKSEQRFYSIAYKWDNLFFACWHCQQAKGRQYSEHLLRPDATDFEFSKYFYYDFVEHEVLVNMTASPEDQQKAAETIRIFDFNHKGLTKARRSSFREYHAERALASVSLNDYNYRFILEEYGNS